MSKPKLYIVKIGGNVLDDSEALQQVLFDFSQLSTAKILVHGGGKIATRLAERLGVKPEFHNGRRITTAEMLDIAVMSYAGLTNKNVVARLQSFGVNAIGFSGADGSLILSKKRPAEPIDFGFVGDVEKVDADLLKKLIDLNLTVVFSAITHDGNGNLLNTNADTIASEIAIALSEAFETALLYCFEKPGVLLDGDDDSSVISELPHPDYKNLVENGNVHSGMLPKLENCFHALQAGVAEVRVGSALMLTDSKAGTRIKL
ncbi:acetylglutamate kinase [Flavobacterium silvaticum]|uniref:Acetylglutamate kinase n=1 Tax=Flavobacterium silvaticum TaxID=1852020 RepID=A0A972JFH1_9FLAO|nr:acetylglutamate kinase [Flavobacterium silvaticum]NMH27191.1 acetylglutamate kinase [Flavobacterium silvaticum]